jgi:hypothetical protein
MVVLALAATAALLAGCSDATGELRGGQSLYVDPCPQDAGHTWTDLYGCYFGPSGKASCSALSECHGSKSNMLGNGGGFIVLGHTKESAYEGFTRYAVPPDAGPMPVQGATNVVMFLRTSAGGFMPCNGSVIAGTFTCNIDSTIPGNAYTFTPADMDRINTWINEGAQDN